MKIPVDLAERDFEALKTLARNEYRDVRGQAAVLIRDELKKRGLLPSQPPILSMNNPKPGNNQR